MLEVLPGWMEISISNEFEKCESLSLSNAGDAS